MNFLKTFYYKILIFFEHIKISRQKAKIQILQEKNKEIKIALGKHDFPTSSKSTKYPE